MPRSRLALLALLALAGCAGGPGEAVRWTPRALDAPTGLVADIDISRAGGNLRAVSSGEDGRLVAYDLDSGAVFPVGAPLWPFGEEWLRDLDLIPRASERVCVALHGEEVAAGFESGAIWRWSSDAWLFGSRTRLSELAGHHRPITALAYADGPYLLSGDEEGRLRIWYLPDATLLAEIPTQGSRIAGAGWDGLRPVAIDGHGVYFAFELSGRLAERRDTGLGEIKKAVHAGGGGWILLDAGGRAWSIRFGSETTLVPLETAHRATIVSLLLDEAAGRLEARTEDGRVRRYEWPSGRVSGEDRVETLSASSDPPALPAGFVPTGRPTAVARSPDGRLVAAGTAEGWISVWEVETGSRVSHRKAGHKPVRCLAFHPVEPWLARGTADGWIVIEREPDGMEVASWRAHEWEVNAIVFADGGRALISAGRGPEPIVVWRREE